MKALIDFSRALAQTLIGNSCSLKVTLTKRFVRLEMPSASLTPGVTVPFNSVHDGRAAIESGIRKGGDNVSISKVCRLAFQVNVSMVR